MQHYYFKVKFTTEIANISTFHNMHNADMSV